MKNSVEETEKWNINTEMKNSVEENIEESSQIVEQKDKEMEN